MRSRYSAYEKSVPGYLLDTWHASSRPQQLDLDVTVNWLGLRVLRTARDDENRGLVEFVARYRVGGASAQRLHEVSRFVREGGRWYYLSAETDANDGRS